MGCLYRACLVFFGTLNFLLLKTPIIILENYLEVQTVFGNLLDGTPRLLSWAATVPRIISVFGIYGSNTREYDQRINHLLRDLGLKYGMV